MKPTPEQMAHWQRAALASHFVDLKNGKRLGDIAGITDRVVVLAASWAREHALEEAAKVCDHEWNGDSSSVDYDQACNDCAQAIRALKEKANEHAPIPR